LEEASAEGRRVSSFRESYQRQRTEKFADGEGETSGNTIAENVEWGGGGRSERSRFVMEMTRSREVRGNKLPERGDQKGRVSKQEGVWGHRGIGLNRVRSHGTRGRPALFAGKDLQCKNTGGVIKGGKVRNSPLLRKGGCCIGAVKKDRKNLRICRRGGLQREEMWWDDKYRGHREPSPNYTFGIQASSKFHRPGGRKYRNRFEDVGEEKDLYPKREGKECFRT